MTWLIPVVDSSNPTGSIEFTVSNEAAASAMDQFFPLNLSFTAKQSYFGIRVCVVVWFVSLFASLVKTRADCRFWLGEEYHYRIPYTTNLLAISLLGGGCTSIRAVLCDAPYSFMDLFAKPISKCALS